MLSVFSKMFRNETKPKNNKNEKKLHTLTRSCVNCFGRLLKPTRFVRRTISGSAVCSHHLLIYLLIRNNLDKLRELRMISSGFAWAESFAVIPIDMFILFTSFNIVLRFVDWRARTHTHAHFTLNAWFTPVQLDWWSSNMCSVCLQSTRESR